MKQSIAPAAECASVLPVYHPLNNFARPAGASSKATASRVNPDRNLDREFERILEKAAFVAAAVRAVREAKGFQ